MLWQKLQREMPSSLGEMILIADSYALGDPTQPCITRLSRVRGTLETMLPGQQGGMITRTMGTREGRTSRITGMVRIKSHLWMLSSKAPGTARSLSMMALPGTRTRTIGGRRRIRTGQQRTGSPMRRCWIAHASTTQLTPGGQLITPPGSAVGTSVRAGRQQRGTLTRLRRDTPQELLHVRIHKQLAQIQRTWDLPKE